MSSLALPAVADAPAFRPVNSRASNRAAISFIIAAPLARVYDRWLQYPDFPHFMRSTDGEESQENSRITWRIRMEDFDTPWEAEVTEQLPAERIAWKNIYGRPTPNSGSVTFRAISEIRTQVTLAIEFEFASFGVSAPDPVAALASRLERNLVKFGEFARALDN